MTVPPTLVLCRIVLDAAYCLHDRVFAENLGTILLYAIVVRHLILLYAIVVRHLIGNLTGHLLPVTRRSYCLIKISHETFQANVIRVCIMVQ